MESASPGSGFKFWLLLVAWPRGKLLKMPHSQFPQVEMRAGIVAGRMN